MDSAEFEGIRRYVGFDAEASAAVAELLPRVAEEFPRIVEDFYAAIERDPDARRVLSGGDTQVSRLKGTLTDWLKSSLSGPHDMSWVESRKRIGLVHVRIGLEQRFMLSAMSRVRTSLVDATHATYKGAPERRMATEHAVHRLLDLELAIMLDSYYEYLSESIRTHERLATIGQIAASVGHELRNPLGIIESSLFLVRQRLQKLALQDESVDKHNNRIQRQVAQCSTIIKNLLDLARDRPPRPKTFRLVALIAKSLDELALSPRVRVEIEETLPIDVDVDDFGHVLGNLLGNANEAMGASGEIVLSASRTRGGTELVVEDSGPGVPAEIRDRIFDALFTTKARGTGLGLALCRRIVRSHGGEIELVPSDRGARFRVWFPDSHGALADGTDD